MGGYNEPLHTTLPLTIIARALETFGGVATVNLADSAYLEP